MVMTKGSATHIAFNIFYFSMNNSHVLVFVFFGGKYLFTNFTCENCGWIHYDIQNLTAQFFLGKFIFYQCLVIFRCLFSIQMWLLFSSMANKICIYLIAKQVCMASVNSEFLLVFIPSSQPQKLKISRDIFDSTSDWFKLQGESIIHGDTTLMY